MATEAGWSDHKLTSRLSGTETRVLHYNFILKIGMQHHFAKTGSGQTYPDRESTQKRDRCVSAGFQGEEQGYRSVWLLLRKEQKTKAKLDKLKSVGTEAVPTAVAPTTAAAPTAVAPMSAAPTAAAEPQQQQPEAVVPVAAALASAAPQAAESRESLAAPAVAVAVAPESGGTVQQPGEEGGESATTTEGHVASEPAAAAAAAAAAPAPAPAAAAAAAPAPAEGGGGGGKPWQKGRKALIPKPWKKKKKQKLQQQEQEQEQQAEEAAPVAEVAG